MMLAIIRSKVGGNAWIPLHPWNILTHVALPTNSRELFSSACFVAAIAMAILDKPILSTPFFYYLAFIGLGIRFARIELRWTPEVILCLSIGASAIAAVGISVIAGRNTFATAFLASATALLIPLLFVKNTKTIFYALIPLCYGQAIIMAWQWFTHPEGHRAAGFAYNANAGSSLLLLGAIFLVSNPKLKWLAVPLLVAIPFSGSRWVLVIGIIVFGLMFGAKHLPWKYVLVAVLAAFIILFALQHDQLFRVYRMNNSTPVATTESHIEYRLALPVPINMGILIPQGFIDSNLHNVPLRMSVETGLLSGLAWTGVGGLVLWRRPKYDYAWWMMLSVCLLSVMYYHTWIGPTGIFWWILTGKLMNNTLNLPNMPLRRLWGQIRGVSA